MNVKMKPDAAAKLVDGMDKITETRSMLICGQVLNGLAGNNPTTSASLEKHRVISQSLLDTTRSLLFATLTDPESWEAS